MDGWDWNGNQTFFQIENTKIPFYKAKHFNSCLIFVTTVGARVKRLNTRKCIFDSFFVVFLTLFWVQNLGFKNPTCVKEMRISLAEVRTGNDKYQVCFNCYI